MNKDEYGRVVYSEREILTELHKNPKLDVSKFYVNQHTADQYNNAVKLNYSDLELLKTLPEIQDDPVTWHHNNQNNWHIPEEYKSFDIAKYILEQCNGEVEIQRCGAELLEYAERDLLPLLTYIKYLVDTMRQHKVVWGVGRGSSVASFVLYKLGLHKINSIEYDLDFHEFMR